MRLGKLLFLFRENATTLSPRQPRAAPIVHEWTERQRTDNHSQPLPKARLDPESFPDQFAELPERVTGVYRRGRQYVNACFRMRSEGNSLAGHAVDLLVH
jgi:hypothetical protein